MFHTFKSGTKRRKERLIHGKKTSLKLWLPESGQS
ncbi:hypothetical protein KPSB59_3270047 [Klebsiella quasipneumoniae subsp. quasipneumoniae]|nr:hypothetical protein KPSB59_3270047 [Klebsiella quasipneumoniae subsp. quasipneumoniae]